MSGKSVKAICDIARILLLGVSAGSALLSADARIKVLWESSGNGYRIQGLSWLHQDFSINDIRALAEETLRLNKEPFLLIRIIGTLDQRRPSMRISHGTYDGWRKQRQNSTEFRGRFAELVRIAPNAVLRIRSAAGDISRTILTGSDPLIVDVEGRVSELLWFSFATDRNQKLSSISVHCRSGGQDDLLTAGRSVYSALAARLPFTKILLYQRRDVWFAHEADFPDWYPFAEAVDPPLANVWSSTPMVLCGESIEQLSCLQLHPR